MNRWVLLHLCLMACMMSLIAAGDKNWLTGGLMLLNGLTASFLWTDE